MIYFLATVIAMLVLGLVLAVSIITGRKPAGSCSTIKDNKTGEAVYCAACDSTVKDHCELPSRE